MVGETESSWKLTVYERVKQIKLAGNKLVLRDIYTLWSVSE